MLLLSLSTHIYKVGFQGNRYRIVFEWLRVLADGCGSWIGQTHIHTHRHAFTLPPSRLVTGFLLNFIVSRFPLFVSVLKENSHPLKPLVSITLISSCTSHRLTSAQSKLRLIKPPSSFNLIARLCLSPCKIPHPSRWLSHLLPLLHLTINHIHQLILGNLLTFLSAHFPSPLFVGCLTLNTKG